MATTNTLRLRVGGKYKTRGGQEVLIDEFDSDPTDPFPFGGLCGRERLTWKLDGTFFDSRSHDADLVSEIPDEAPEYRYFRWREDAPTDKLFVIWRKAHGTRLVEGWLPNKQGDEWTDTDLSLTGDLLSDPAIIECDAEGFILGRPEAPGTPTLTPESRTRIAKLAARMTLADGPILSVDELAGMTVAELVARLEGCDYEL